MRNFLYFGVSLILSFPLSLAAQNVSFSLDNAQQTSDGVDNYYEADVLISSSSSFVLGSGQLYFNYNTAAFGPNVVANGNLTITRPENAILSAVYFGSFEFYQSFIINDNIGSRFSYSWQQGGAAAGCLEGNRVTTTPSLLFHVKIKYRRIGPEAVPDLCFETGNLFDQQTFTACGPYSGCVAADYNNFPPVKITDEQFSCDPGNSMTWYADTDADGYGDSSNSEEAASQPPGFVDNDLDCDDQDPNEFPDQVWYADIDGDGISEGQILMQCERPAGYALAGELTALSGDNCPDVFNPSQTDTDGAGIGDACDCDDDDGSTESLLVIDRSTEPDPTLPDGTYQANREMEVTATVTANSTVILTAGHKITLKAGFVATAGSSFHAYLDNCEDPEVAAQSIVAAPQTAATVLEPEAPGSLRLKLYPNPVSTTARLQFYLPEEGAVRILLYDTHGRLLETLMGRTHLPAGTHTREWSVQGLVPGLYLLYWDHQGQINTLKFIKGS